MKPIPITIEDFNHWWKLFTYELKLKMQPHGFVRFEYERGHFTGKIWFTNGWGQSYLLSVPDQREYPNVYVLGKCKYYTTQRTGNTRCKSIGQIIKKTK